MKFSFSFGFAFASTTTVAVVLILCVASYASGESPGLNLGVDYSVCEWDTADAHAALNVFKTMPRETTPLPSWNYSRDNVLPSPIWDGHDIELAAYWKTWELAFKNLRVPSEENGFVSNWIDTAFNGCTFMWDSSFILLFGRYGTKAFPFINTLNNFYAKQHIDGFICREIRESDGGDQWYRHDPSSTGPNIMAWTEWVYYENFGDLERLKKVFDPLYAYYGWLKRFRTWRDGMYWSCGLACGMDNMPRVPPDSDPLSHHGWMTWIDATFQSSLSAKCLSQMALLLNKTAEMKALNDDIETLNNYANTNMWSENQGFYFDVLRNGSLSEVVHVGALWGMIAEAVPEDKMNLLIQKIFSPSHFNRPHMLPSLSASHPQYQADGGYWRGAVWAPTNFMVLRGLTNYGFNNEAYHVALNHYQNVIKVFNDTNTVWENYMPEAPYPGHPAKSDFVGWTGLVPIAVLFEYILGLRANVPEGKLVWDVRQLERHGVYRYPFGVEGMLKLECKARASADEKPKIRVKSNVALILEVHWGNNNVEERNISPDPNYNPLASN